LDEPSLGLAPLVSLEIFRILRQVNREEGITILLVEQDATSALSFADYGYVVETGRVVIADTSEKLKEDENVRRTYLGY
jgi:branched-chain amino acid transport system ATP-binding protein